MNDEWAPDSLSGFERLSFALGAPALPGESPHATLVRRTLQADPHRDARARAVLLYPGWNDYFFHPHVVDALAARGITAYALDPLRSGRSLTDPAFRDYVGDLSEHDEALDAAVARLRARHERVGVLAHSTGGLVTSLWASGRPGRVDALALNSPWIAWWGSGRSARLVAPLIARGARRRPHAALPVPGSSLYARSLHVEAHGSWDFDPGLKSFDRVPVRLGWLAAVLAGQRRVAQGLGLTLPVLVVASARSGRRWRPGQPGLDLVLDVASMTDAAPLLGAHVEVVRIEGGCHDGSLSPEPAGRVFLDAVGAWFDTHL